MSIVEKSIQLSTNEPAHEQGRKRVEGQLVRDDVLEHASIVRDGANDVTVSPATERAGRLRIGELAPIFGMILKVGVKCMPAKLERSEADEEDRRFAIAQ